MAEGIDDGGNGKNERRKDMRELLLKEYDRCAALFQSNEQMGEGRVTFFITLTGAVLAALISLYTSGSTGGIEMLGAVAVASLLVLLMFGIFTLRCIVRRNQTTDEYKVKLDRIRRYFVQENDKDVIGFLPVNPYAPPKPRVIGLFYGKGGLMETVMLMNSIVAGAGLAFLVGAAFGDPTGCGPSYPAGWVILAGGLGAVTSWFLQVAAMRRAFRPTP